MKFGVTQVAVIILTIYVTFGVVADINHSDTLVNHWKWIKHFDDKVHDNKTWIDERTYAGENPEVLYRFYTWVEIDGEYNKVITIIRNNDIPGTCAYARGDPPIIEIEQRCLGVRILHNGICDSTYWHEIVHIKLPGSNGTAEHQWMEENVRCH